VLAVLFAAAALCNPVGVPPFETPDNSPACTPGSHVRLTQHQACTPTPRGTLPAKTRRDVLGRYGLTTWTGTLGELDHRVPWFLTHDSAATNIWPERETNGRNPKDILESYIWRRVCRHSPAGLRVKTARLVFLSDWRAAYKLYIGPVPAA
jgi:hypothetical protein